MIVSTKKGAIGPIFLVAIFILSLVALAVLLRGKVSFLNFASQRSSGQLVRGLPNDFWADRVVGKRDFGEIGPNKVVPNRVFRPGGTVVDTSSATPGRVYIWDGGNSRILGIDLAKCYGTTGPCSADIVLGQPSDTDMGGCNNDSSFSSSPNRKPASATSLCGMPENTHTTLEDKSLINMFVDQSGNLYVPDAFNHRILKYAAPITNNAAAVEVWGQPDFSSNGCNFTGDARSGLSGGPAPKPTANSLCFHSVEGEGAAVAFDPSGNMWVADGGNNRVLRYPKSGSSISKTPDLVVGQPNFTTGGDWSNGIGSGSNTQFHSPQGISFDQNGTLYVADSANDRVLKIPAPYTTSSVILKDVPGGIITVVNDSLNRGFWTRANNIHTVLSLWDYSGKPLAEIKLNNYGAGGFGFDKNNHLLVPTYDDQDVFELIPDTAGTNYTEGKSLFSARNVANLPDPSRFYHPAWGGIAVTDNQLIVAINHLRFWNNPPNIPNGKNPDGFVGVTSDTDNANPEFGELAYDGANNLWVTRLSSVELYNTPLTNESKLVKSLSTLTVLGGGSITLTNAMGVAVVSGSKYLWIAENENNRVLRVRDPLTNPVVDVIIGQTTIDGHACNQGLVPARDKGVTLTMLCNPGMLSLDRKGNLYVSDHVIELAGNFRTLLFSASSFPDNLTQVLLAPKATKEFPRQGVTQDWAHANFQAAFDSTNRMVIGNNPYTGFKKRYLEYYNDPTRTNPSNPSDPTFAEPDGNLNDFYGWPVAMTFDSHDNLYVYDANRGQARIYFEPFNNRSAVNHPPVAKFITNPKIVATGNWSPLLMKFDASTSTDPDPGDQLTYSWDFGDGTVASGVTVDHTYVVTDPDPGKVRKWFTVKLTVTDKAGLTSVLSVPLSVGPNHPPRTDFTIKIKNIVLSPRTVNVDVIEEKTSDADNDIMTFHWNYGDGSPSEKGKHNVHIYKKDGTYQISLTVRDQKGAATTVKKNVTFRKEKLSPN